MCCAKEVSDLISLPVVSLLDTRVGGTLVEVVNKSIYLELLGTTNREWYFLKERNLGSNGRDKKGLSETRRPGLISVMSPDLVHPTHRFEPKVTLGGILFLRFKTDHLCPTRSLTEMVSLESKQTVFCFSRLALSDTVTTRSLPRPCSL